MNDNIYVEGEVEIKDPKLVAWLKEAAEHNTKELEKLKISKVLLNYQSDVADLVWREEV